MSNGTARPFAFVTPVTGMSIAELQELYELREAVEPLATQIAVPNVGRAEHITMRKQLQIMEEHAGSIALLDARSAVAHRVHRRHRPPILPLVKAALEREGGARGLHRPGGVAQDR